MPTRCDDEVTSGDERASSTSGPGCTAAGAACECVHGAMWRTLGGSAGRAHACASLCRMMCDRCGMYAVVPQANVYATRPFALKVAIASSATRFYFYCSGVIF